jgi:hypothetical protein
MKNTIKHVIDNMSHDEIKLAQICYIDDYDSYFEDTYYDYLASNKFGAELIGFGCTKMVFSYDQFPDYVFKIPLRYMCEIDDHVEFFVDEMEDNYTDCGITREYKNASFNHFYPIDDNSNYCDVEEYIYNLAEKNNVSNMFFGTKKIVDYHGLKVYASERGASTYEDYDGSRSLKITDDIVSNANDISSSSEFSMQQAIDMLNNNSFDDLKKLVSFLRKYNVTDLHGGNLMYDNDDKLRICDYSSFHDMFTSNSVTWDSTDGDFKEKLDNDDYNGEDSEDDGEDSEDY